MILDDNLVFFDGATKDGNDGGQVSAGKSDWIPLTGFLNPGQVGPIPIHICLSDGLTGGESLTFTLKHADGKEKPTEEEGGEAGSMTVNGPVRPGGTVAWRFIPRGVTKPWLKLEFSANVTSNTGSVFAAIVREDLTGSYQDNTDLLIDKGKPQYKAAQE